MSVHMSTTSEATTSVHAEPVVRMTNVCKTFVRSGGDIVHAVDDITLEIPRGQVTVLLGPSGCGKTTLLRCIAGLEQPSSGTIDLYGRRVFASSPPSSVGPEKRDLSMVFQSYALWPHMSVFDNVAYPLRRRAKTGRDKSALDARVERVLRMVGIPDLGRQYPNQLSGGQQQRVALARALVTESDLVLFDEPLSNVDAKVREELRVELLAMQKELGFAALFVTHDQTEAMVLADRIAVLDHGRVAQYASPKEIYFQPSTRYVANFIGTTNELPGVVSEVTRAGLEVQTQLGLVKGLAGTPSLTKGDRVVALWRPELFVLGPAERSLENTWSGSVDTTLFAGAHTEHLLTVGGHQFRVWSPRPDIHRAGTTLSLGVAREHVRVLPVGQAESASTHIPEAAIDDSRP